MNTFSSIIIGGGPAGLFCSLLLARGGLKVLLLEKMHSCGRKLLISGSGQCNLTHTGAIAEFLSHYGEHGKFIKSALLNFTNTDLIRFFEEQDLHFCENGGGKLFPESGKARDILSILLSEAEQAGVRFHTDEPVLKIEDEQAGFRVITGNGEYHGGCVILATGGYTYPATGSTGDGFGLAESLGHIITKPGPALTPVHIPNFLFHELSGISFSSVPLTLYRDKKKIREARGDILITHQGLSGPGILDLSRYIKAGDELRVSFLQYLNINTARDDLIKHFSGGGTKQIKTLLSDLHIPERFAKRILDIASVPPDTTCAQFSKPLRSRLITLLLECPFPDLRLGGKDEAMVTRGGVALSEIRQDSMESRIIPGFYCIGEVLDIDGDCGGYNLQAAFSTGALAAESILKKARG